LFFSWIGFKGLEIACFYLSLGLRIMQSRFFKYILPSDVIFRNFLEITGVGMGFLVLKSGIIMGRLYFFWLKSGFSVLAGGFFCR